VNKQIDMTHSFHLFLKDTQQFELQYSPCSRRLYTYEIKTPRLHIAHFIRTALGSHTHTGKSTEQVIFHVLY